MKKSISINIHGILFHIEEDGYEILREYLENIKEYFKPMDGQEEIVADIEARIAEKFQSLLVKGKQVITKKDVNILVSEMGTVQDFAGEEEDGIEEKPSSTEQPKRLFRNPEDKIVAGVCSGIAAYFGIDPVFVRLVFVVLTFFYFGGVVIYLLLWLLMPEAKTPSQKVEMKGHPVTLETLSESLKERFSGKADSQGSSPRFASFKKILAFPFRILEKIFLFVKSVLKTLWRLCKIVLFPIAGVVTFLGAFGLMLAVCIMASLLFLHADGKYFDPPLFSFVPDAYYPFLIVSAAITLLIPLFFILILGISLIRRKFFLSGGAFFLLLGLWFCGIFSTAALGITIAPQIVSRVEEERSRAEQVFAEKKEDRVLPLGDFTRINISGRYQVEILSGPVFSVTATGDSTEIGEISAEVREGTLTVLPLRREDRGSPFPICLFCFREIPRLRIVLPVLEEVKLGVGVQGTLQGSFTESLEVFLDRAILQVDIRGENVKIEVQRANFDFRGTAETLAIDLDSSTAEISATGETVEIGARGSSRGELRGEGAFLKADVGGSSVLDARGFIAQRAELNLTEGSRIDAYVVGELQRQVSRDSLLRVQGRQEIRDLPDF